MARRLAPSPDKVPVSHAVGRGLLIEVGHLLLVQLIHIHLHICTKRKAVRGPSPGGRGSTPSRGSPVRWGSFRGRCVVVLGLGQHSRDHTARWMSLDGVQGREEDGRSEEKELGQAAEQHEEGGQED